MKFAKAMVALVNAPRLPQRLALGSDTLARIVRKNHAVEVELSSGKSSLH
jgi:hypothetical protein